MSFSVPLNSLSEPDKIHIREQCIVTEKKNVYKNSPKKVTIYSVNKEEKTVILPLGLWKDFYDSFPNLYTSHKKLSSRVFKGKLLDSRSETSSDHRDQVTVVKEAFKSLKETNVCLLALHTGFGKSVVAIYLSLLLGFKTIIICHYRALHSQWIEYISRFTNLKAEVISKKTNFLNNDIPSDVRTLSERDQTSPDIRTKSGLSQAPLDIYIVGAKKASKLDPLNLKDIGTVIVDEVESICTETFSLSLQNLKPRFLIGCSATPDRADGLHKILYPYFGPSSSFIFRKTSKKFTVIKYNTEFIPEVRYNFKGNIDWVNFISSLSNNLERQKFICDIITKEEYKERRILVFVSRIDEINNLYNTLREERNESVDFLTQSKKTYDKACRILIGTYKKIGVGFDVTDRDLTIFSGDCKDIRQPEGRVRLENNTIIDVVDKHYFLQSHWEKRKKWYLSRGAEIKEIGEWKGRGSKNRKNVEIKRYLPPPSTS